MDAFRAAHGQGPDWREACEACVEQLRGLPRSAGLGFVYASDPLAEALDLIVARLREATRVRDWVGTGGAGVCASGREDFDRGALVALVTSLPADRYRVFDGFARDEGDIDPEIADWALETGAGLAVVHGDSRQLGSPDVLSRLSERSGAFLVGGLTSSGSPVQIAGQPTEGALSGVMISAEVPVITGLTQGCVPIGATHEVTAARGFWASTIDGRPALDVLKEEIGEVLARNLERIGGFIHIALPVKGSDRPDYLVRNLIGVDVERRAIAVAHTLRRGDQLMFVKRDGSTAQLDLQRMLDDLKARAAGRRIRGALYHTCVARGPHMFGPESAELGMIERAIGPVPLAGFFTNGEIFCNRLYAYTGVLTLFL